MQSLIPGSSLSHFFLIQLMSQCCHTEKPVKKGAVVHRKVFEEKSYINLTFFQKHHITVA